MPTHSRDQLGLFDGAQDCWRGDATSVIEFLRPLRVQLDATRPLSSWRFTVANSRGQVVYSSHGAAPDGGAPAPMKAVVSGMVSPRKLTS